MTYSNDLKIKILKCISSKKYTNVQIIKMFNVNKKTFYKIKNDRSRILKGGSKYKHKNRSKRSSKITKSIITYIRKYITTNENFDYIKLIQLIKKNYNISISKTSIYNILNNSKIKKKIYFKQINTRYELRYFQIKIFKKKVKNALKKSSMNNIISIDESSIDSYIYSNKAWSKYGSKTIKTRNHIRIRYTLILAISNKKILHYKIIKKSANGEIFLEFIKDLIRKLFSDQNYHVIIDNARIHHYKKLKEYIKNVPFFKIIYNVPYNPETNPVEHVFNDIKRELKNMKINNTNIFTKINNSIKSVNKCNFKNYFIDSLIEKIEKISY